MIVHTAIIGAGPTGLFLGSALARRGHQVSIIDRDPGPARDGSWPRRGVMQFHHAHLFRPQVVNAVRTEMPDAYQGLLSLGAEPITVQLPDGSEQTVGLRCRRQTFETALRASTVATPGVALRLGHVDAVTSE